jgi:hypothetical protein
MAAGFSHPNGKMRRLLCFLSKALFRVDLLPDTRYRALLRRGIMQRFGVLFLLALLAAFALAGCRSEQEEDKAREQSYQSLANQRKAEDSGGQTPVAPAPQQPATGD